MPVALLLVIVVLITFLVLKSLQDSKGRSSGPDQSTEGASPAAGRYSRLRRRGSDPGQSGPKPSAPAIDQDALAAHVAKLRAAVAADLISDEEAVASVLRQTKGGLSEEAARRLLDTDDRAA